MSRVSLWTLRLSVILLLANAMPAAAHTPHICPPGVNDAPTFVAHQQQHDLLKMRFEHVFEIGQRLFIDDFNQCDGAGRPGTNGGIAARRPDPLVLLCQVYLNFPNRVG